ncbi:hypothetical protein T4C_7499 [Trichinella pseudospiralis]|uniref:Uncharacterized protein n=1 Tax=Trichinella pseudospiralis TaxID=6337 RepID=A0A0V1GHQ0_TRIPS|nr:hypothetical protein T4C_7499 [Trichinella pseudospiralis]
MTNSEAEQQNIVKLSAVFLLSSVNMTNSEAEQHSIFIHLFI